MSIVITFWILGPILTKLALCAAAQCALQGLIIKLLPCYTRCLYLKSAGNGILVLPLGIDAPPSPPRPITKARGA